MNVQEKDYLQEKLDAALECLNEALGIVVDISNSKQTVTAYTPIINEDEMDDDGEPKYATMLPNDWHKDEHFWMTPNRPTLLPRVPPPRPLLARARRVSWSRTYHGTKFQIQEIREFATEHGWKLTENSDETPFETWEIDTNQVRDWKMLVSDMKLSTTENANEFTRPIMITKYSILDCFPWEIKLLPSIDKY